jgi:hypothetical protein
MAIQATPETTPSPAERLLPLMFGRWPAPAARRGPDL